ncbi:CU044_5270 family protein [Actinomadura sediminis]|uniref:CU044_5270 family protein n=1 Tax=Actinomadura sediminis TaxID=1038904 RepID=A0ABW3EZ50_9ACTN
MDETQRLRERYDALPGPEPRSVAAARARLDAHLTGAAPAAARGRRRVRPTWGLGLLTAGAAAALAVTTVVVPGDDPAAPAAPVAQAPTARTILLAAADQAATAPADGKYWHVATLNLAGGKSVRATWTTRDGRRWTGRRSAKTEPGVPATELHELKGLPPMGTTVLGADPSLSELQGLPTDPAKLKATAERNIPPIERDEETGKPVTTRHGYLVEALVGLITDQPVTPKVRAAAFRVLAATPGVKTAGKATDELGRKGVVLTFELSTPQSGTTGFRLIIDPKTSQVLARRVTADPKRKGRWTGTTHYLAAEWTNEAPAVPNLP